MTVLEVITAAASYLEKHEVESARLNAEHLLAHVLDMKRMDLYLAFDRPVSEKERSVLRDLVRRRAQGEPLQHLLGTVEFCGREFQCDARALIPRPETEELFEWVRESFATAPARVADVGTGSGVLAVSLALTWPEAEVLATDVSPDALALARENAARHGVEGRIQFCETDLLPPDAANLGVIVANLPYIPAGDIPGLSREVRRDPVTALDGGKDGMEIIRRLIVRAREVLCGGGRLFLEIGLGQHETLEQELRLQNYQDIQTKSDYQGVTRFLSAAHG